MEAQEYLDHVDEANEQDYKAMIEIFDFEDIEATQPYFKIVQTGIAGKVVREIINATNERELFARVLERDKSNLSRVYKLKVLPRTTGDSVLDAFRTYVKAVRIFQSLVLGREWMHTPIPALGGEKPSDILDTPAGRELVRQTLNKIEYGEFS